MASAALSDSQRTNIPRNSDEAHHDGPARRQRQVIPACSLAGTAVSLAVSQIIFFRATASGVQAVTSRDTFSVAESFSTLLDEFDGDYQKIHVNCMVRKSAFASVQRHPDLLGHMHSHLIVRGYPHKLVIDRTYFQSVVQTIDGFT
jgi:DNA-binding LytR/AlgR family response regulator